MTGFDQDIADFVASRIPGMDSFGPCSAIGVVDRDHHIAGGVVYHDYQPQWGNIQLSFASDRPDWLTPSLIRGLLFYPFYQLGCERITCLTPKRNRRARQFLQKFGFRYEGNVRRGFGTDDCIISGLLRSEWESHRFYGRKINTQGSGSA